MQIAGRRGMETPAPAQARVASPTLAVVSEVRCVEVMFRSNPDAEGPVCDVLNGADLCQA